MKILNLYAGIGGNRKLWGNDHNITAVEYNEDIAAVYSDFFPKDEVVVGDAHEYLLNNIQKDWDFIWASPPCPTHSKMRHVSVANGSDLKYPDMRLYQEILLLKHFSNEDTKWVVENVQSYYKPLIEPYNVARHYFWSNFYIKDYDKPKDKGWNIRTTKGTDTVYGFNIKDTDISNKRKVLRNMVDPRVGEHILNEAFKKKSNLI